MTPTHSNPRRFLRAARRAFRPSVGLPYLQKLAAPLRASCRRFWPPRPQPPHRCLFDTDDGMLYASRGLVILRCRCGVARLFGRW